VGGADWRFGRREAKLGGMNLFRLVCLILVASQGHFLARAALQVAPASLRGRSGFVAITSGERGLPSSGVYRITFAADVDRYTIQPISGGVPASEGTVEYNVATVTRGGLVLTDSVFGRLPYNIIFSTPTVASLDYIAYQKAMIFLDPTPHAVVNVSVRATVTSDGPVIQGLALGERTRLLVRVAGPALARLGVERPLADPRLALFLGSRLIARNDDWSAGPEFPNVIEGGYAVGAFPFTAGSADAALVVELEPGNYTFVVEGPAGAGGEVLFEIYRLL
jgi:hypothetical protein